MPRAANRRSVLEPIPAISDVPFDVPTVLVKEVLAVEAVGTAGD